MSNSIKYLRNLSVASFHVRVRVCIAQRELTAFLVFILILFSGDALAQNMQSDTIAHFPASQALSLFLREQQALAAELQDLIENGGTSAELTGWFTQNAAQLAAQEQKIEAFAANQPVAPSPYITEVDGSDDASPTMQNFLTQRADLMNIRAQIRNEQLQINGTVNEAQVEAAFQAQNAPALQALSGKVQVLGQEASQDPLPVPPPLVLPIDASTKMQAFLVLRDQFMRATIQLHNQNLSLSSQAQAAALAQWQQQNSSTLSRLQQMSADLN